LSADEVIEFFNLPTALGFIQPLTEINIRLSLLGVKRGKADNLTTICELIV
jgi:hypothetical protein